MAAYSLGLKLVSRHAQIQMNSFLSSRKFRYFFIKYSAMKVMHSLVKGVASACLSCVCSAFAGMFNVLGTCKHVAIMLKNHISVNCLASHDNNQSTLCQQCKQRCLSVSPASLRCRSTAADAWSSHIRHIDCRNEWTSAVTVCLHMQNIWVYYWGRISLLQIWF